MRVKFLLLALLCVASSLAACGALALGKDDYKLIGDRFFRGDKTFTILGIRVPDLAESGGELSVMAPALARIAEAGGNAVCFDLTGFNEDGTKLSAEGRRTVSIVADRAKDQRMATVVRVLGDSTDSSFRFNAVVAAADALKSEGRALYWIDGPDANKLTKRFKRAAANLLVASPEKGDMEILTEAPSGDPEPTAVYAGVLPEDPAAETMHFVLDGTDADYAALREAMANPAKQEPWTPDNSVLSEDERAEGFIALFNGKNLDGWWYWGDNEKTFAVNENGEIEYRMPGGSAIMTRNRYDDFILRLEYKIEEGGNSGIFLRAPRNARQSKIGMEFQIHGDPGVPVSDDMTGAIYKVVAPRVNASGPTMEWNSVEIICDGAQFKATLNGQAIHDLDLDENEELRYRLRDGFIGLQDHGHYVAFRNVRLKAL